MAKLYRSAVHAQQLIAQTAEFGWVIFPAKANGWEERKPGRGLDPLYLRQVPVSQAAGTGFLEWIGHPEMAKVA